MAGSPQRRQADGGAAGTLEGRAGDAHLDRAGGRRVALGGRGRGSRPSGSPQGWGQTAVNIWTFGQGSEDSHLAQDGAGMGAARGTAGSRGPGHLWVPQEAEGRGHAAESGVFFGWW